MTRIFASILAATLLASTATTASAGTCNVVANHVTGDGNFVDLDVSGCGYVSNHMRGSFSFAQIINRLGRVVTGIYGNGHYYEVRNLGDNQLGVYVDGTWHRTNINVRGDDNEVDNRQTGRASSVKIRVDGNGNDIKTRTH